ETIHRGRGGPADTGRLACGPWTVAPGGGAIFTAGPGGSTGRLGCRHAGLPRVGTGADRVGRSERVRALPNGDFAALCRDFISRLRPDHQSGSVVASGRKNDAGVIAPRAGGGEDLFGD